MAKKRVYEIAKEKGVSSKDLLEALRAAGVDVKAAASTVEEADAARVLGAGSGNGKPQAAPAKESAPPQKQSAPPKQAQPAKPATDGRAPQQAGAQGQGQQRPPQGDSRS